MDGKTIRHYLDLLVDLLLVRQLQPLLANPGKRLVKSPRIYVRDSGLVHTLLGLDNLNLVLGHPVAGSSWEGFVIEWPNGNRWAVEIKRSSTPRLSRGFQQARADLLPPHRRGGGDQPARTGPSASGSKKLSLAIHPARQRQLAPLRPALNPPRHTTNPA